MRNRAVGLGLVVAACVGLGACASDTKRLTAAQLTAQGNAVCTKLQGEVTKLADSFPVSINFTPEQMQDFYTKMVPLVDNAVIGFKALEPPKDLEEVYDAALVQVEIDRKTFAGATKSPTAAKNLFETRVDPFTATNQKLASAGITACGGTAGTGGGDAGSPTTAASVPPTTAAAGSSTTAATGTPTTQP